MLWSAVTIIEMYVDGRGGNPRISLSFLPGAMGMAFEDLCGIPGSLGGLWPVALLIDFSIGNVDFVYLPAGVVVFSTSLLSSGRYSISVLVEEVRGTVGRWAYTLRLCPNSTPGSSWSHLGHVLVQHGCRMPVWVDA